MTFNVQENRGFLIGAGIAVLLVIVFFVLWRGAVGAMRTAQDSCAASQESYQTIVHRYGGEPGPALVAAYTNKLAQLKSDAVSMRAAVSQQPLEPLNPTEFKDLIKKQRDVFVAESEKTKIRIPEGIGFEKYLGAEVPDDAELPRLKRQFALIKDLLSTLFDLKVEEVTTIERNLVGLDDSSAVAADVDIVFPTGPSARQGRTAEAAAQPVFEAVPVRMQFRTTKEKLYAFIARVHNLPAFYRIRSITTSTDVQAAGEVKDPSDITEQTIADVIVDYITLREKTEPAAAPPAKRK